LVLTTTFILDEPLFLQFLKSTLFEFSAKFDQVAVRKLFCTFHNLIHECE